MNRRGFLAFLAATPLAGWLGLRPRLRGGHYEMIITDDIHGPTPTMTPAEWSRVVGESTSRMVDEMSALGEEVGKSHARVKAELASKAFGNAWK